MAGRLNWGSTRNRSALFINGSPVLRGGKAVAPWEDRTKAPVKRNRDGSFISGDSTPVDVRRTNLKAAQKQPRGKSRPAPSMPRMPWDE